MRLWSTDEPRSIVITMKNLLHQDFSPQGVYWYGYFYNAIILVISLFFKSAGFLVGEHFIGMSYRLLSLTCGLVSAFLMYKILLLCKVPILWALFGSFLLFSEPKFYYWSHIVHPDTLQTALILAGFYFAFAYQNSFGFYWGTVLLGLAFGTKWAGIFGLPFIILPIFLNQPNRRILRKSGFLFFSFWQRVLLCFL